MRTRWLTVVRDLVNIVVGAFGLIHSQLTGNTSLELIVVYAALLGVPGALALVERKSSTTGTKESSSQSHAQPSD